MIAQSRPIGAKIEYFARNRAHFTQPSRTLHIRRALRGGQARRRAPVRHNGRERSFALRAARAPQQGEQSLLLRPRDGDLLPADIDMAVGVPLDAARGDHVGNAAAEQPARREQRLDRRKLAADLDRLPVEMIPEHMPPHLHKADLRDAYAAKGILRFEDDGPSLLALAADARLLQRAGKTIVADGLDEKIDGAHLIPEDRLLDVGRAEQDLDMAVRVADLFCRLDPAQIAQLGVDDDDVVAKRIIVEKLELVPDLNGEARLSVFFGVFFNVPPQQFLQRLVLFDDRNAQHDASFLPLANGCINGMFYGGAVKQRDIPLCPEKAPTDAAPFQDLKIGRFIVS